MKQFTVTHALTFGAKSRGLIGQKPFPLLLKTRWGIHTFGMIAPILVVVLNQQNQVVTTRRVIPNRFFFWNPVYDTILELPDQTNEEFKEGKPITYKVVARI